MHGKILSSTAALLLVSCGGASHSGTPGDDAGSLDASPESGAVIDGGAGGDDGAADASTHDGGGDATSGDGSVSDATPEGDAGADAAALVLPQVQKSGGATLAHPKLVAVTFPGDDEAADIHAFTMAVGGSDYWKAITSEYGVGAATGGVIVSGEAAPATLDNGNNDAETWLSTRFDGTHPEWGTFDPNAIYLVYYPSSTAVTPVVGGCGGAYHNTLSITVAGEDGGAATKGNLLYANISRCATTPDVGRPTGLDLTTSMASHEMVEAATDPYGTAYASTDSDHLAWAYFLGSEVGDMCAFLASAWIKPASVGYMVTRSWSDQAAAAFQDPCVPASADPLFLAAPEGQGPISLQDGFGGAIPSSGFAIAAGQSKTIDVRLYGAASGAWTVSPFTYSMEHGLAADPYLSFSFDRTTGQAGDVLHLTIKRLAANNSGYGGDGVKLVSTLGSETHEWYFAVSN